MVGDDWCREIVLYFSMLLPIVLNQFKITLTGG